MTSKQDGGLVRCVTVLTNRHGGLRAAARACKVDHVYLYRLLVGERTKPSNKTLRKLGITKTTHYRIASRERTAGKTEEGEGR